jgi:hypothetical protein
MADAPSESDPNDVARLASEAIHQPRIDGRLGCLITFGVGLLCLGLAWWLFQRKSGGRIEEASQLATIIESAERAPGANAARQAGCLRAAIIETEPLQALAQRLEDARARKERRAAEAISIGTNQSVLICLAPPQDTPSCETVARAFAHEARTGSGFVVAIRSPNGPACSTEFTKDGELVRDVPDLKLPPVFDIARPD